MSAATPRSRMRAVDTVAVGAQGLRGRPGRAVLSALGVAIGVAAVVGVLGLSSSSSAALLSELDRLGTDLLRVRAGSGLFGEQAVLPEHAASSAARLPGVRSVAWTADLEPGVYRSRAVDRVETSGLRLRAASPGLVEAVSGAVASGRASASDLRGLPVAVLGSTAAARLGVDAARGQVIDADGVAVAVVGVLAPVRLAPELDTGVYVDPGTARRWFGWDGAPGVLYQRSGDDDVARLRALLPRTVDPEHPDQVEVSRPSDALAAKAGARSSLTSLLLGLGAVALLVGAVGVANVMVIAVLERRGEIGLRRALGATRRHVAGQFAVEAVLLAVLGSVGGAALGAAVTAAFAQAKGWEVVIPGAALAAAGVAGLVVGAVAGVVPAVRAARLSPTEALATL